MARDAVARMKRRPLVGMLALSKLVTKGTRKRAVRFVDHLFVLPAWRGRGVGQTLLHQALEANAPLHTTGADESKASKNQPLVALVVRKHAPQQAAARRLYARGGLKGRPVRRGGFERAVDDFRTIQHNGQPRVIRALRTEPVDVQPLTEGARDALEEYREASLPARHWQTRADARFSSIYKVKGRTVVQNSSGPSEVFASAHPDYRLVPGEALRRDRAFWNALKEHHSPRNGGDGDDPLAIVAAADYIVPAYDALPDGLTIGTVDAHDERQRRREWREIRREEEEHDVREEARMDLQERQADYLARHGLTEDDMGEIESDWDPDEWSDDDQ